MMKVKGTKNVQLEFYSLIKIFKTVDIKEKELTVTEGPKNTYKVSSATMYCALVCVLSALQEGLTTVFCCAGRSGEFPDLCAKAGGLSLKTPHARGDQD